MRLRFKSREDILTYDSNCPSPDKGGFYYYTVKDADEIEVEE